MSGLRESVYKVIRQQISSGKIAWGDHLTEIALAESLGVSRTPVREGLAALAREGLLVREGRSYVVPKLTLDDIEEVYEMRCLLEPEAVRQACLLLTAADLVELRAAIISQRTADHENDTDAFIVANRRFRECLFARVRNSRLRRSIALYNDATHFIRVTLDDTKVRQIVIRNLDAVMALLAKRNPDELAQIWEKHITASYEWVRDWIREKNGEEEAALLARKAANRTRRTKAG